MYIRLLLLCLSLISGSVYADFSAETCTDGSLTSKSDFSVVASIGGNMPRETIWANKPSHGSWRMPVWSNDDWSGVWYTDRPIIEDSLTNDVPEIHPEQQHYIWLSYEAFHGGGLNKTGWLTYYIWKNDRWKEVADEYADFRYLADIHLHIKGEGSADVKCSDDDDEPDPPIPPEPDHDSKFEFGVVKCSDMTSGSSCSISFAENFSVEPLVFIMPTIDTSAPDKDRPSTLRLTSVSKTGAVFKQVFSNPSGIAKKPISEVSYFAMEPGKAVIDGETVQAGSVDIKNAVSKYKRNNWKEVEFKHEYDDVKPVVLTEIQTINNGVGTWFTTAVKSVDDEEFDIALERSHLSVGNYKKEKVAYLAAPPLTAMANGKRIQFGYDIVTKRTSRGDAKPLALECAAERAMDYSFKGIVANKQQRSGGDGGWLRRCKLGNSKVSFVVDENASIRAHASERVGYVAFEGQPEPPSDMCDYFPEPAQSWSGSGSLTVTNATTRVESIRGWSEGYKERNLSADGNLLNVGFSDINLYGSDFSSTCEVGQCQPGGEYAPTPEPVMLRSGLAASLRIEKANYEEVCGPDSLLCSFEDKGDYVELTMLSDFSSLTVSAYGVDFHVVLKPGSHIKSFLMDGAVRVSFADSKTYTFGSFSQSGQNASLAFGENVTIRIANSFSLSNKVDFLYPDGVTASKNSTTIFYGPDASFSFHSISGDYLYGYILAKSVTTGNGIGIFGAVTSQALNLTTESSFVEAAGKCMAPTPASYTIYAEPATNIALSCEASVVKFQIKDSEGNNSGGYTGNITITYPDSLTVSVVPGKGTGSGKIYQANSNGELWFAVDNNGVGDVRVAASIVSSANPNTASSDTKFVAKKFSISPAPLGVIAGKEQNFTVQPMQCEKVGGDYVPVVDSDYSGSQTLTMSALDYKVPSSPSVRADLKLKDAKDNLVSVASGKTITLNFTGDNNVATSAALYPEAGSVAYELSQTQCVEEDGKQKCKTYYGAQQVDARPWTLAICEEKSHAMDGTDKQGSAFVAAGDSFDIRLKPVVWSGNLDAAAQQGKYTDFCSLAVTKNFFDTGAESSQVSLSAELPDGYQGKLSGADSAKKHTDGKTDGLFKFDGLSFSDAGYITLKAEATGYGSVLNGIDSGKRQAGRFYPKHIRITENSWNYAQGHSGFAYLDQPVSVDFSAQAQNSLGNPTVNYSKLNDAYKATLVPFTASGDGAQDWGTRMVAGWTVSKWDKAELKGEKQPFTFLRLIETVTPKTSRIDGPFSGKNLMTGLKISLSADPTVMQTEDSAKTKGQKFPTPLIARYGRVILEDLGGSTGQDLAVPLRTEYWDGDSFVTNTDDSGTRFNGVGYCRLGLWPDDTSLATFRAGEHTVGSGQSNALVAIQGSTDREQVRLWLRTAPGEPEGANECSGANTAQPWLNFNWRGEGDEIPSTVLTFGSYRGNDRVIYRGERGMTGR